LCYFPSAFPFVSTGALAISAIAFSTALGSNSSLRLLIRKHGTLPEIAASLSHLAGMFSRSEVSNKLVNIRLCVIMLNYMCHYGGKGDL
jgi:hypothetical protein